jgi:hypothetical protein
MGFFEDDDARPIMVIDETHKVHLGFAGAGNATELCLYGSGSAECRNTWGGGAFANTSQAIWNVEGVPVLGALQSPASFRIAGFGALQTLYAGPTYQNQAGGDYTVTEATLYVSGSAGKVGVGVDPRTGFSAKFAVMGGNVGIGTYSPDARVQITGPNNADQLSLGYAGPYLRLGTDNNSNTYITSNAKHMGGGTWNYFDLTGYGGNAARITMTEDIAFLTDTTSANPITWATRMIVKNDGKVGIGDSNPERTLHVAGTDGMRLVASALPSTNLVAGDIAIDSSDGNKLKWYNGTAWQTAGGGGGAFDNINQAIWNVDPSVTSRLGDLQSPSSFRMAGFGALQTLYAGPTYASVSPPYDYTVTEATLYVSGSAGRVGVGVDPRTVSTAKFAVIGGTVGIGTYSPTTTGYFNGNMLEVEGGIKFGSQNPTTDDWQGYLTTTDTIANGASSKDDVLLTSDGGVLILSDRNYNTISGNISFGVYDAYDSATKNPWFVVQDATGGIGEVGIGTANPASPLHVFKTQNPSLKIQRSSDSNGDELLFAVSEGAGAFFAQGINVGDSIIRYEWGRALQIGNDDRAAPNGYPYVTIGSTGNVGIGQTSPAGKLVVNNGVSGTGSSGDAVAAYANSLNSALYAEQDDVRGYAGYFSGQFAVTSGIQIGNILQAGTPSTHIPHATVWSQPFGTFSTGADSSITIGADGLPAMAYTNELQDVYLMKCLDRSCQNRILSEVDNGPQRGGHLSMAISTDGDPIIAYYYTTGGDLMVTKCSSPSCSGADYTTTVDSSANPPTDSYISILIGRDGFPLIEHSKAGTIVVTKCNDDRCSTSTTSSIGAGAQAAMALGVDGLPVIAYRDGTNLKVAHCNSLSGNPCSSIDLPVATVVSTLVNDWYHNISMTISSEGLPLISYYDWNGGANRDLRVHHCGNITCSSVGSGYTVYSTGDVGQYSAITVGTDGKPLVVFHDLTNTDLRLIHCGDTVCGPGTYGVGNTSWALDTSNAGRWPAIAIGADGLPIISHYDSNESRIEIIKCGSQICIDNWTRR